MSPPGRRPLLLGLFAGFFFALTLGPFDFHVDAIGKDVAFLEVVPRDAIFNVLGFLPIGALLYRPFRGRMAPVLAIGVGLSLLVECLQLFLPTRHTSISDLVTNTLGAGLGFALARRFQPGSPLRQLFLFRPLFAIVGTSAYLGALTGFCFWVATSHELRGWDPGYRLWVGNEATLNRPWLGTLYAIALYDRALTPREIEQHFSRGPRIDPESSNRGDPVALYAFDIARTRVAAGREIPDLSSIRPRLPLRLGDPERVRWVPGGGIELIEPTYLVAPAVPEKIVSRFQRSGSFSVAVWFTPGNLTQRGPARLVSLSADARNRNFTLGQERNEIHLRVRNPLAGRNGTDWYLTTPGLSLHNQRTHAVAVYDRGAEFVYLDGRLFGIRPWIDPVSYAIRFLDLDGNRVWQRLLFGVVVLAPLVLLWLMGVSGEPPFDENHARESGSGG